MAVDVIDLLHDLLDPEMLTESLEAAMVLVDGLLKADFVILLTDNLTRLDEGESDEQAEAIHNILGIVENLIELEPSLNDRIVKDTKVLDFALARLRKKPFHPNKLYASEVLGILLQTSEANQQAMVKLHGIDALLVAGEPVLIRLASNALHCGSEIWRGGGGGGGGLWVVSCRLPAAGVAAAAYKRKDPVGEDEQELCENIFGCMCSALMQPANKSEFRSAEGIELMLMIMKEKKCYLHLHSLLPPPRSRSRSLSLSLVLPC